MPRLSVLVAVRGRAACEIGRVGMRAPPSFGSSWPTLTLVRALFELFVVGRLLYDVKDGDGELGFGQGEGLGVGRRGVRLRSPRHGTVCVRAGAGTGGAVGLDRARGLTMGPRGVMCQGLSSRRISRVFACTCMSCVAVSAVGASAWWLVLALSAARETVGRSVQLSSRLHTLSPLPPPRPLSSLARLVRLRLSLSLPLRVVCGVDLISGPPPLHLVLLSETSVGAWSPRGA